MGATTAFVMAQDTSNLQVPTVSVNLSFIVWLIVPFLILPAVMQWQQKWRAAEFGFRRPTSKWIVVSARALFALAGMLPVFGGSEPTQNSISFHEF